MLLEGGGEEFLVDASTGPFRLLLESGEEDLDLTDLELEVRCSHPVEVAIQ